MYILRGIHTHARISTDTLTNISTSVSETESLDEFKVRMRNVGVTDESLISKLYSLTDGVVGGQNGETKVAELSRRLSTPRALILSRDVYVAIASLLAALEQTSEKLVANSDSDSDSSYEDVSACPFQSIRDKQMDLQSIVSTILARKMSVESISSMLTPLLNSSKSVTIYTKPLTSTSSLVPTNGKELCTVVESANDRLLSFMEYPGAYHTSSNMIDIIVLSNITDEVDNKVWVRSTVTHLKVKGTTHQNAGHITVAFNVSNSTSMDREIILRLFNSSAMYYRQDETMKYELVPFVVSKKGLMGGCVVIRMFIEGISTWARYCSQVEMMGMLSSVVNTLTEHREAFYSPGLCVNLPSDIYDSLRHFIAEKVAKRQLRSAEEIHATYSNESNSLGTTLADRIDFVKCLESLCNSGTDEMPRGFKSARDAHETFTYIFMLLDLFDIFKVLKEYSSQDYKTKESITATLKQWISYRNGVKNYFKIRSEEIFTEVCNGTSDLLHFESLMAKFKELREFTKVHR
jgi:hypothetical protein